MCASCVVPSVTSLTERSVCKKIFYKILQNFCTIEKILQALKPETYAFLMQIARFD